MSESQYDYLDRVVRTHISECNGELPRLSFEKELERQRLAGDCCADTIQKEIDRLAAVSVLPLYPSPRSLEEKMAALDIKLRPMTDCEGWGGVIRRRGNLGAASPPFARVPNHNNQLLLLL